MPIEYKFKAKPYEVALKESLDAFGSLASIELIPITEAVGRRIAIDAKSRSDMPPYNMAFYDGYAVKYEDTVGASASSPKKLRVIGQVLKVGDEVGLSVTKGTAVYLSSNSPLPDGANAVVRDEYTSREGGFVLIKKEVELHEDVILKGEDIKAGDIMVKRGTLLRPQDLVLLMEMGIYRIPVYREPTIAIASVGDEILEKFEKGNPYPDDYCILLSMLLRLVGIKTVSLGILRDNPEEIASTVSKNIGHYDAIALMGGGARGAKDFTGDALDRIGETIFHATTISPGKISGVWKVKEKPAFLVPGHIGSAIVCLYNFVIPVMSKIYYDGVSLVNKVSARLTIAVEARPGSYTVRTVNLNSKEDGTLVATPLLKRLGGSTLLTTLSRAHGYIVIPPGTKLSEGSAVEVTLFSPLELLSL
ncbi:MAG: molybdopterin molybdotransferase MoeA [Nitrososphaerota archaeon]